jgi:hypothetical protein
MQAASDLFLGWTTGSDGRHDYLRQLRDVKISAIIEGWEVELLVTYGRLCAWALARAHAQLGGRGADGWVHGFERGFRRRDLRVRRRV